ncbi:MAG: Blue-light-activated protein, partial [Alphaproteobacteria bacterium MarineAlpha10_Bin1]
KQADVDPGDYVVLIVSDTGCGIAEDTLGHVFEPFFTTKDVGKGSGLGLSMVYGFAKQSGGAAVITSTLGDGTEIKLYLPVRAGHGDEIADNQSIAEIPRSQGERVLVVEDDDEVRALAVSFLSDLGYDTAEADSAQTALEMLENAGAIDLVLSDVVLPGAMNGPDLMAELRRRIPAIKIIYMTGYAERTFNHPGGLESGTRLIRKPFKKTDFANAIRQTLDEV